MKDLGTTKGRWEFDPENLTDIGSFGYNAEVLHKDHEGWFFQVSGNSKEEAEANVNLICEAGNVANETGLTPKQLLEQRDELAKALELNLDIIRLSRDRVKSNTVLWQELDAKLSIAISAINKCK